MLSKQELRQHYRRLRNQVPDVVRKEESEAVCRALLQTECYQKANAVFCYLSYGSEPETSALIRSALYDNKIVAVPKISEDNNMLFAIIDSGTEMSRNKYGILEPEVVYEADPEAFQQVLLILPGLCYDDCGGRIGYGGGYYDRYLAKHNQNGTIFVASLALSCQHYEAQIIMEPHDVRPDMILYPDRQWSRKGTLQ